MTSQACQQADGAEYLHETLTHAACLQSVVDLGGRFFGGRTVSATFFSEDRFDKQDLGPKAGEPA